MKSLLATSLLLGLTGCATPLKLLYEAEMAQLCAKDGGIRVYERVPVPAARFTAAGQLIHVPAKNLVDVLGPDYSYRHQIEYLRGSEAHTDLSLSKTTIRIIRKKDGKLLGESISYSRNGGGITLGAHPTGATCPMPYKSIDSYVFYPQD